MLSDLAVRRMAPRLGESSTLGRPRPRKVSDGRSSSSGAGPGTDSLTSQRGRARSFGEPAHRSQGMYRPPSVGSASVVCSVPPGTAPHCLANLGLVAELISSSHDPGRDDFREESPLVDLVDSTVSSSSLSSLSSCANSVVERPVGKPRPRRPDFLELGNGPCPGPSAGPGPGLGHGLSHGPAPQWHLQRLSTSPPASPTSWVGHCTVDACLTR